MILIFKGLQEVLGTREDDHLFQINKGYFLDLFEGTGDISTINGNFDKKF